MDSIPEWTPQLSQIVKINASNSEMSFSQEAVNSKPANVILFMKSHITGVHCPLLRQGICLLQGCFFKCRGLLERPKIQLLCPRLWNQLHLGKAAANSICSMPDGLAFLYELRATTSCVAGSQTGGWALLGRTCRSEYS